jgi:hypothetical protein
MCEEKWQNAKYLALFLILTGVKIKPSLLTFDTGKQ